MPHKDKVTEGLTRQATDVLNALLESEHTQDFEYVFKNETGKTWFQTEDGYFFGLAEGGAKKYTKLIHDVLDRWKNLLSLKYATNQIDELLEKSLSNIVIESSGTLPATLRGADIDGVRNRVLNMVADFDRESAKDWTVYLPLSGIELTGISGDSLKIGCACLKYMNKVEMDALFGKIDSIIFLEPPAKAVASKGRSHKFVRERVDTLKETVCAVYLIKAESERAIEIAEERTQDVLDLLSYFTSFKYSRSYKGAVRLQGELARDKRTTLLLSPTTDAFHIANRLTGEYIPVQFTKDDIKDMKRLGIFEVSAIIESGRPNKFQKTVLAAIHWFAASRRQETPEIEFVNLVTCLENCLTPDDDYSSIRASIAEGCALLLTADLEPRRQLRNAVLDIYGIRSKIVHSGQSITSEKNKLCLAYLRVIARDLLLVLIKQIDDFKSKEDLLKWLTEQKLAPKSNAIR